MWIVQLCSTCMTGLLRWFYVIPGVSWMVLATPKRVSYGCHILIIYGSRMMFRRRISAILGLGRRETPYKLYSYNGDLCHPNAHVQNGDDRSFLFFGKSYIYGTFISYILFTALCALPRSGPHGHDGITTGTSFAEDEKEAHPGRRKLLGWSLIALQQVAGFDRSVSPARIAVQLASKLNGNDDSIVSALYSPYICFELCSHRITFTRACKWRDFALTCSPCVAVSYKLSPLDLFL